MKKYLELFKLKKEKIVNSGFIMYKALAAMREMAFSSKELKKDTEQFLFSVVMLSLITRNKLTFDKFNELAKTTNYTNYIKKLKIKEKNFDEEKIKEIKDKSNEIYNNNPLICKIAVFFDKLSLNRELRNKNDGKSVDLIYNDMLELLAYANDEDDKNNYINDLKKLQQYLK